MRTTGEVVDTLAREQLALLCVRIEGGAGPFADGEPLGDLVASIARRVRAGEDTAAVADSLDELDDRLLRMGYAGGLGAHRSGSAFPQVPGLGGHPVLEVLKCPGGVCPRVALPGANHRCAVFDEPLERVRLRP